MMNREECERKMMWHLSGGTEANHEESGYLALVRI
jgi:hypothetical protein